MARARNIKPGFFKNEDLVELPFEDRLLFIGLWTLADREGRLEDRPKRIKMEVFPADDVDVEGCLTRLASTGMIIRYEVENARYIEIVNFLKHQRPHGQEKDSEIPPFHRQLQPRSEQLTTKVVTSSNQGDSQHALIPDTPLSDTGYLNADYGGTANADAQAQAPAKPKTKRATHVPPDFDVTDALIAWGKTPKADFSESEMRAQVPKFIAWYQANGKPMKDWHATFQSWMYKSRDFGQTFAKPKPAQGPSRTFRTVDDLFSEGNDDGPSRNQENSSDSATRMAVEWPGQDGDSRMDVGPRRHGLRSIAGGGG